MFRQIPQSSLTRAAHTSQPRFKYLPQITASERQSSAITLHQPTHMSTHATLDNAKQNLLYQTHLMKVRSACKLDEATIVGKYLGTIRKDYDQVVKETARGLSALQLKRKDIDFLKTRNKVMQEQRQEADKLMIRKEKEVVAIREMFQEASMQTKILENIITRMKKDEIHYKQLGRIRDEQLKRKVKDHKLLEEKIIHSEEKLQKLMNTRDQCKSAYNRNRQIRQQKFHDFQGGISGVRERDEFLEERRVRTYQLQSIELNDTLDEKNIHMRQITLASKVADCLLEGKVARMIESNSIVQEAFHLVRAKTGICEPQLLTAKFFSYEQTAESLLESIHNNEQRIRELTAKKKSLSAKYQKLMNESYVIAHTKDAQIKCYDDHINQKEVCIREINKKKLLAQEIKTWIDTKLLDLHTEKPIKALPIQEKITQLYLFITQNIKKCQTIDWKARKSSLVATKKRPGYETTVDEPSLQVNQCSLNESAIMDEECIRSSRQVAKKGFSIKHFKRQSVNPSPK